MDFYRFLSSSSRVKVNKQLQKQMVREQKRQFEEELKKMGFSPY